MIKSISMKNHLKIVIYIKIQPPKKIEIRVLNYGLGMITCFNAKLIKATKFFFQQDTKNGKKI